MAMACRFQNQPFLRRILPTAGRYRDKRNQLPDLIAIAPDSVVLIVATADEGDLTNRREPDPNLAGICAENPFSCSIGEAVEKIGRLPVEQILLASALADKLGKENYSLLLISHPRKAMQASQQGAKLANPGSDNRKQVAKRSANTACAKRILKGGFAVTSTIRPLAMMRSGRATVD